MDIFALVIGVAIFLVPLGLVWYINAGGVYAAIKRARSQVLSKASQLMCSADTDCPPGYICQDGRCVPTT